MLCAKKVALWIWKLINMEGLWKGIFACFGFAHSARNAWVETRRYFFLFLEILTYKYSSL
jgi:hypothetical protein